MNDIITTITASMVPGMENGPNTLFASSSSQPSIEDISQLETEIRLVRARNARLEQEQETLLQFVALFESYDQEQSAAHRSAKLLELKSLARKIKREVQP